MRNDDFWWGGDPFTSLEKGLLVTAEDPDGQGPASNPMTVSWGLFGILYGAPTALLALRESRYTLSLLQKSSRLTISRLPEGERFAEALCLCGRRSGREGDKWAPAGLHPTCREGYFFPAEAERVLFCRLYGKIPLQPGYFTTDALPEIRERFYPTGDYHTLCLCRIEAAYPG